MVAHLRKTDVAALRDRLLQAGLLRNANRLARKQEQAGEVSAERIAEIRSLQDLTREARQATVEGRAGIEARIVDVTAREGVKFPARTTVGNVVQLINRALKHAGQTMGGVPDLSGVPMPAGSPGRDRRVSDDEMTALIKQAGSDPLMPLIMRFAVATTLRRERLFIAEQAIFVASPRVD